MARDKSIVHNQKPSNSNYTAIKQRSGLLAIDADLAEKIGIHEAIVLEYMINCPEEDMINSYVDWQEKFRFLSLNTVKRTFASLEKHGLLKHQRMPFCNVYQLCFDKIDKLCPGKCSGDKLAKSKPLSRDACSEIIARRILSKLESELN